MTPQTPAEEISDELDAPAACAEAVVTHVIVEARSATPFVTASHDVLFAADPPRCDACGSASFDEDRDDNPGGHGLYVWARNGAVVYEEPPLCASCARAITITALQRWEIEEEEG
jgi:hypothetical protein